MALPEESAKVVLLGDSGVGKSSLALRLCRDEFRPYSESTIGASFMTKTLDIQIPASSPIAAAAEEGDDEGSSTTISGSEGKERRIEFKIWDTAGQEKYASLAPMYYRGAAAAILVYDISDRASFFVMKKWADEISDNGPEGIVLAVCGNKSDLAAEARHIPLRDAEQFATDIGAFYMETSARDDSNVLALFVELGKRIPESMSAIYDENGGMGSVDLGRTSRKSCCS